MMSEFDHLVCIDQESRRLAVYRISDEGKRTLLAEIGLPTEQAWTAALERIARQLGENLLMDSSKARRLLDI